MKDIKEDEICSNGNININNISHISNININDAEGYCYWNTINKE